MSKNYDSKSIKMLSWSKAIQLRPGMYVGSTEKASNGTNSAIYQLTKEVLDNAVDEHLSKYANKIYVSIEKDGSILVADNGRGIPIEYHKAFKTSTLVGVFSNMHASGKFDKDSYETSIGLNGVGVKCVNALSSKFEVWTHRKSWYYVRFEHGVLKQDIKKSKCPLKDWSEGTIVKFTPSSKYLDGKLDFEKLRSTIELLSYITSAFIKLQYHNKSKVYHSTRGLLDYLSMLNKKHNGEMSTTFQIKDKGIDLALCWIDKDVTHIDSFVNASPTKDGGTHVKGLQKAITESFKSIYKKSSFDWQDISTGLLCVLSTRVDNVKFDSQIKDKLITKEAEQDTYSVVYAQLTKWIKKHKDFCDDLVDKAEKLKSLRSKATDERAVLKALKGKKGKSSLPPTSKFAVSTTKNPEERILFLVEGLSAAGSCKNVRNPKIHEVLALKGKIMNAMSSSKKLFESEEVVNILKAIGYNEQGTWRVGKVVAFQDRDDDGAHIFTLLMSLFATVCPNLLKEGRVYKVDAPLFIGRTATTEYYGKDLADLYRQSNAITSITRVKGWGECPASVLKKIVFSDEASFKQMQYKDADYKSIKEIMGSSANERKALLELLK